MLPIFALNAFSFSKTTHMTSKPAFLDKTIKIVHNDLTSQAVPTLTAIMHDEIYFLPEFLTHYRQIGVQKFIILDDRSTDGSREYLNTQKDVMIVESAYTYGELIDDPSASGKSRAMLAWRQTLLERFAKNTWSIHLDFDEFVDLPDGNDFSSFIAQYASSQPAVIWGAMIDMYPRNWHEIDDINKKIEDIDWYFDGVQHLRLKKNSRPSTLYSGARARLRTQYGMKKGKERFTQKIRRWFRNNPYPRMGTLHKPVLINWDSGFRFRSSHFIKNANSLPIILPIRHYKYTPAFTKRVDYAIRSKALNNQSRGYRQLAEIRDVMLSQNAGFLDDCSMRYKGYQSFEKASSAILPK